MVLFFRSVIHLENALNLLMAVLYSACVVVICFILLVVNIVSIIQTCRNNVTIVSKSSLVIGLLTL